jgi:hypothetical protein
MLRALSVGAWLLAAGLALAQSGEAPAREPGPIQDNSFLVEEAYNQEPGVVQHIQQFTWVPSSGSWIYTFTQEWPVGGIKNQLSFTLTAARVTGGAEAATGLGDVFLNYRYQLVGNGEAPVAVAPRLSVLLPTGSARRQLGTGGAGVQIALPVSVVLSSRFYANGNAGATWTPRAQDALGERAGTIGYNFGGSLIWRGSNTLDLMLETVWARAETPSGPGRTTASSSWVISPGVRWAYNFPSGLQIVPGIGVPIGVGPSHDRSVLVYLSFEHPFVKTAR